MSELEKTIFQASENLDKAALQLNAAIGATESFISDNGLDDCRSATAAVSLLMSIEEGILDVIESLKGAKDE